MLNVPRLLEELRFITIHPDRHNQSLWAEAETVVEVPENQPAISVEAPRPSACGSFGCLAGNTAIHEPGVELDWYEQTYYRDGDKKIVAWQADNILNEYITVTDQWDGSEYTEAKTISEKARELLGLTYIQAELLFDGDNNLDQMWELAERFSGAEISASITNTWDPNSYGHALAQKANGKDQTK